MWVVYTKLYRGEGWQTEQRELPLPVSEIERWAKGQGVVPCLAYDEREVLWMDADEEEDTALEIAKDVGVAEDLVLRWFERKQSEAEYGDDERGCDDYHRLKDNLWF